MNKEPDETTQRLHQLERDQLEMRIRLGVLERALWSLVLTHPHPSAFADNFEQAIELVTAIHLNDAKVTDETREHAHQWSRDLLQLARGEATIRKEAASALLRPRA